MPIHITLHSSGWGFNWVGHSWIEMRNPDLGQWHSWGTCSKSGVVEDGFEFGIEGKCMRKKTITQEQYDAALAKIEDYKTKGSAAWNILNPCSGFAAEIWKIATGEDLDHTTCGISTPQKLEESAAEWNSWDGIPTRGRAMAI